MVRSIDPAADGSVSVLVALTVPGCPLKNEITRRVETAVAALDGVTGGDRRLHGDDRPGARGAAHPAPGQRPRPRPRPRPAARPRRGPADPVRPARLAHPTAVHLLGQGRRRQVERHDQPRRRPRRPRPLGRHRRRRHLRLLDPPHARRRAGADGHRRDAAAARGVGRAVHLDRLLRARGPGRRVARPDAAQGARAVPHRRLLGRPRLPARRHAARHRRHRHLAQPVPAAWRGVRRDDAAAGGPEGRPAVGGDGRQGQPARCAA